MSSTALITITINDPAIPAKNRNSRAGASTLIRVSMLRILDPGEQIAKIVYAPPRRTKFKHVFDLSVICSLFPRTWFVKIPPVLKIPARAWVLSLLSGGLQIVIFPHANLFFLCWIAFVPLLYALLRGRGGEGELLDSEGRSLRPFTLGQGFLVGWISGILWYIGTCYWIYPVMHGYGNLGVLAAALITAGFCLIM